MGAVRCVRSWDACCSLRLYIILCVYLVDNGYLGHCLYLDSMLCFFVTSNYNLLFPIF